MAQKINSQIADTYPLVTVTIPSYNAATTLAETLESVLAQTYPSIEIIVVDDGSTDNTQDVLKYYSKRVRVVSKTNGGLASARNAGFLAAQGKYIALLDADDLCMPERIAMQVAYLEQNPDIILCCSNFGAFNNSGFISETYIANYYPRVKDTPDGVAGIYPHLEELSLTGYCVPVYYGNVYKQIALGNFVHPPTVLFRRSILNECGLLDESIVNACDVDWLVRMSRLGDFGYFARPLLKYRVSENQMSGSRHRVQGALDTVYIKEKTLLADPLLYNSNRKRFRRCLGEAYLDAADALVETHPLAAMTKLVRSVMFGVLQMQSLKVLFKLFTPLSVLQWRRNRRLQVSCLLLHIATDCCDYLIPITENILAI